jgi:N-acetylglucosamine-6-phosphate deacetylase
MALISDAIAPAGLGDGEFQVWNTTISVCDGKATLAGDDGREIISGSVISLRQAVANMVKVGVPLHDAWKMASLTPARITQLDSSCGSIEAGKCADLIALDEEMNVRLAISGGIVAMDRRC